MSSPYRQPARQPNVVTGDTVHVVQPPPQDDAMVREAAEILLAGMTVLATAAALAALLGVSRRVALIALTMTRGRGSTAHRPNARHAANGLPNRGPAADFARSYAALDVYYRAAYVLNAMRRIDEALTHGEKLGQVVSKELRNYDLHEQARRRRLDAASNIAGAVEQHGDLLGWYLDPELNNEIECVLASGNNFYASRPPIIGLPGLVHDRCGCHGGPPHFGGRMVDEATADVIRLGDETPLRPARAG